MLTNATDRVHQCYDRLTHSRGGCSHPANIAFPNPTIKNVENRRDFGIGGWKMHWILQEFIWYYENVVAIMVNYQMIWCGNLVRTLGMPRDLTYNSTISDDIFRHRKTNLQCLPEILRKIVPQICNRPGLSLTLKRQCRHFDEILIIGCTGSCHFDNFQCSQWWKFHQNEDISVSVKWLIWYWRLQMNLTCCTNPTMHQSFIAPLCNRNVHMMCAHFCYKICLMHCGICERWINIFWKHWILIPVGYCRGYISLSALFYLWFFL